MHTTQEQINKGFDALHESVASILDDDTVNKDDCLAETFGQASEWFAKLVASTEVEAAVEKTVEATAYDRLMQLADQLRKAEPKLTEAKAFAKAFALNPKLARQEREERRAMAKQSDAGDRLVKCAMALRERHPEMSHDDAIATVKMRNPELVSAFQHERTLKADQGAAEYEAANTATATATDRVYARASALCRQHPGLTLEDGLRHVMQRNPELATAATNE